jgi:hypothetical protein
LELVSKTRQALRDEPVVELALSPSKGSPERSLRGAYRNHIFEMACDILSGIRPGTGGMHIPIQAIFDYWCSRRI